MENRISVLEVYKQVLAKAEIARNNLMSEKNKKNKDEIYEVVQREKLDVLYWIATILEQTEEVSPSRIQVVK